MRAPAARVRDASVVFPTTATAPVPHQGKSHPSSKSVPLRRGIPPGALPEFVVSGVVQPHPATGRTPISMAAQTHANLHEPSKSERDLAAEIARVMHRRPLMNRLANVESAYAVGPSEPALGQSEAPSSATVPSQSPMSSGTNTAATSTTQARQGATVAGTQPQRDNTSPPRSAEWLGKARRARNRERLKNALAWLSTVAIGGTIIATTMVALQS